MNTPTDKEKQQTESRERDACCVVRVTAVAAAARRLEQATIDGADNFIDNCCRYAVNKIYVSPSLIRLFTLNDKQLML